MTVTAPELSHLAPGATPTREPMHPTELVRIYLDGVRSLSGAVSATLYVPAGFNGSAPPMLIHSGDHEPVAELATLRDAAEWGRAREPEGGERVGGCSVHLAGPSALVALLSEHVERRTSLPSAARRATDSRSAETLSWLGVRFSPETNPLEAMERAIELLPPDVWPWLLELGAQISQHTRRLDAAVRDPITLLLNRGAFYVYLAEEAAAARRNQDELSVLLVHTDGFSTFNREHGTRRGNRTLREIASRIPELLRRSDLVFRYGGAVFAVLLPSTAVETGAEVARKLAEELTARSWGPTRAGFRFRAGVAGSGRGRDATDDALELVRRADQALLSASTGSRDPIAVWSPRLAADSKESFDRLSGIFTGDTAKDYRNMALLWDGLQLLNRGLDVSRLAAESVELFQRSLNPDRVLLVDARRRDQEADTRVLHGLTRNGVNGAEQLHETDELTAEDRLLIARAVSAGEIQATSLSRAGSRRWAIPACTGGRCLACLLLEGREDHLRVEDRDRRFLGAILSQLALALEQSRQAQATLELKEAERRRLRSELGELRDALGNARLLFASEPMAEIVQLVHRVAPSDVTVLISGASGTGKELMARTLHELSPRKDGPWVVVDCGAITSSLIESELFGHVKGAYTGAGRDRVGRLAQADGGTVLLDEIGELPLEVQSRLLRFVQERQVVSVGSSAPRSVDVRIVAATNRNLQEEVAAGRFREDLFYRLNVIHVQIPPLAQRPADIPLLARHFVRTFSVQYQRGVRGLTAEAEEALLAHPWPGNVRELQNRMLKAVLFTDRDVVDRCHLGLDDSVGHGRGAETAFQTPREGSPPTEAAPDPEGTTETSEERDERRLQELRELLRDQVGRALKRPRPLRGLLADQLLFSADRIAEGNLRRGADLLGLAETTFRRRLRSLQEEGPPSGDRVPPSDWTRLVAVLEDLIASGASSSLLQLVETILLEEIELAEPPRKGLAARLFDVSLPTYRRRLAALREEPRDEASTTD